MPFALLALLLCACRKDSAQQTAPQDKMRVASTAKGVPELRAVSLLPGTDAAVMIEASAAQAAQEGKKLVVYIGATWCEPCLAWHDAVAQGKAGPLPAVQFLEFDLDKDGETLARAGYATRMVPYFARPGRDGRASSVQFAGVRKGGDYVAEIRARRESSCTRRHLCEVSASHIGSLRLAFTINAECEVNSRRRELA